MKAKAPLIVDVFLLALVGLTIWGVGSASFLLHEWRTNSAGPPFFWIVGLGSIGVISIYAIDGIVERRLHGLYLGLLPLLVVFGLWLRVVSNFFRYALSAELFWLDIYARMATVGFAIGLGLFIIKLGFSKTVAAYFAAESNSSPSNIE